MNVNCCDGKLCPIISKKHRYVKIVPIGSRIDLNLHIIHSRFIIINYSNNFIFNTESAVATSIKSKRSPRTPDPIKGLKNFSPGIVCTKLRTERDIASLVSKNR